MDDNVVIIGAGIAPWRKSGFAPSRSWESTGRCRSGALHVRLRRVEDPIRQQTRHQPGCWFRRTAMT